MIRRTFGLVFIILITLTGLCWGQARSDKIYSGVLRLHVIANSDSAEDQSLKLKVRDAVVEYLSQEFQGVGSADQARQMAVDQIPELKKIAVQVVNEQGCRYPVEVEVGLYDFPAKTYGDLFLPRGEYQAVRVVLGEGKGRNWWCVLFPPLCLASTSDQGLVLDPVDNAEIKWKFMELLRMN